MERHVIKTQEIVYRDEHRDYTVTKVACSCGAFDEVPKNLDDYQERLLDAILTHKIEVLAAKLDVQFVDGGELPGMVHPE